MKMTHKVKGLLITIIVISSFMHTTIVHAQFEVKSSVIANRINWVNNVYNDLTLEEKIGQLFMIAAYSGTSKQNDTFIAKLIEQYHIGGLIFMQGTPAAQATQTNRFQRMSKVPLMIGMDAEWGLGMRLTGVRNFPRQMMLGATKDSNLVYSLGSLVAEQCKIMGVHFNFAPVVDINNNPQNPVINFRSFGEDKYLVTKLGLAYMHGMQNNEVLASAKHFPGHGDVDIDSHYELPVIHKSKAALLEQELHPFSALIEGGIASVMVAHLSLPQLEPQAKVPSTLSYNIITKLLKEEMQFDGLIITDALNMEGVAKYFPVGEVDLKAFQAGNDILLFSQDVPKAVTAIKKAIENGIITEERLAYSVKKILRQKYDLGLHTMRLLNTQELDEKLNASVDSFFHVAAQKSITVLNESPTAFSKLTQPNVKIAYMPINGEHASFEEMLQDAFPNIQTVNSKSQLDKYDVVIVGVSGLSLYPGKDKQYGIAATAHAQLSSLALLQNSITIFFGNPYAASNYCQQSNVIITYEDHIATQRVAVDVLQGKLKAIGTLPVSICSAP